MSSIYPGRRKPGKRLQARDWADFLCYTSIHRATLRVRGCDVRVVAIHEVSMAYRQGGHPRSCLLHDVIQCDDPSCQTSQDNIHRLRLAPALLLRRAVVPEPGIDTLDPPARSEAVALCDAVAPSAAAAAASHANSKSECTGGPRGLQGSVFGPGVDEEAIDGRSPCDGRP